jgi:hypothetical protein
MTREAEFLSGDVMERHWGSDDSGLTTALAARRKGPAKKRPAKKGPAKKRKSKPRPTARHCTTGKKTCRLCRKPL